MTQVAMYMRLYYLKIESKVTSKHILNGNKTLKVKYAGWVLRTYTYQLFITDLVLFVSFRNTFEKKITIKFVIY